MRYRSLTIDETRPLAEVPRGVIRSISIDPGRSQTPGRARPDAVDALLARIPHPDRVEYLSIHYDCRLRRLPAIDRFPNLTHVKVRGRRITDYEPLFRLRRLQDLSLWNFKHADLSQLDAPELESFRAVRGRLVRFDIAADSALLQNCRQLREFAPTRLRVLWLEACNQVDLNSLARVEELARVDLISPRALPTVDFIAGCRTLTHLVVTATAVGKTDFSALTDHRSLRKLFLPAGAPTLRRVSALAPQLVVSNGEHCFVAEEACDPHEAYYGDESD